MADPSTTPEEIEPTADGTALRIRWRDGSTSILHPRLLQFVWSDGHDTGIYPFDYLRRLGEQP